jgi:hypothetical protein
MSHRHPSHTPPAGTPLPHPYALLLPGLATRGEVTVAAAAAVAVLAVAAVAAVAAAVAVLAAVAVAAVAVAVELCLP